MVGYIPARRCCLHNNRSLYKMGFAFGLGDGATFLDTLKPF
jgi:hypothetical protein